ncbi:hypothetical protein MTX26_17140 [Bradyrhizobium sp. ISRA443]|uniref:hypothetical protein n=1 Tax=unclassified Bradyrhizobium TaxID=2631580 RepID=UPI00247B02CA|nr:MULTISPECIES: hypothetical protein [unclassified Bradyrhizobium]WGR92017.1 hypothetical protein MTX20_27735 [Bradyrhizobium sp. ISRA435]WGS02443.1 hypothetical protein MTX23_17150 [Bradyrhizobium sp. ISRA436]WGS09328.1 hypothetical protein MTX18_17140 [Bradyrhizobium sp. ISRA437]WGS16217.1 hypothetical protein MTX26_17140 [Bradyrhizobium sp. ISRA443]
MYVIHGPYVLLAVLAITSIVAVHRDLVSTTQFRIMIIGAGVLALVWSAYLGAVWLEYR